MYIFQEDKDNERTETSDQFPLASNNIQKLKNAIRKRYKDDNIIFQRKYGAVISDDVLCWIRKIGKVIP